MTVTRYARWGAVAAAVLAVVVPTGANAMERGTGHGVAPVEMRRYQRIATDVRIVKKTVVVTARARVLALALQVTGTETWTDAAGTHVIPLSATPTSVDFGALNVVRASFPLHRGATVVLTWTAEGADVLNSVYASTCYGSRAIFDGGNWYVADQPC